MSVYSPVSIGWRGPRSQGFLNQAYDPAQSFAYTSVYSGVRANKKLGEQGTVLDRDIIQEGLSDLGRTSDGLQISYLTLSLPGYGLVDVSLLLSYPHLQRLNLSSNNLTDISVLSNLPYLTFLDVSFNKLTTVLDFEPPHNLTEVNYAQNEIEGIGDLSAHHSLNKLNLDSNQIAAVSGLEKLGQLSMLSLADNRLENISNLDHLPLKYLNLGGNSIRIIEGLNTLKHLQVLDLSGNRISSFKGLEDNCNLLEIHLGENKVVSIDEVRHLSKLRLLKTLTLERNPLEALAEYRATVIHHLPSLTILDHRTVDVKEKVSALNRFTPPAEVTASYDHRINVMGAVKKPARIRFSTLTCVDEPYPMLVLCGPPGSGKGQFAQLLVEEFPSFFGLGVSHTTRPQRDTEGHGRDYYFIDEAIFNRAASSGEFVQMFRKGRIMYGLTMAAIEQVAQQGLACVTHMNIDGVLTLKKTHFEPRYILTLPLTPEIHKQRLMEKRCYTDQQIEAILREVDSYKQLHQANPGFFDTSINTDNLSEGYNYLRAVVMAYGDISPESPLSLTSGSQQTTQQTTSVSTSERTTPQPDTGTHTPSTYDPFEKPPVYHYQSSNKETLQNIQNVSKSWARPHSSLSQSEVTGSVPFSGGEGQWRQGTRTPLSDQGGRRHLIIKAAVAGRESISGDGSMASSSRPGTSLSKSGQTAQRSGEEMSEDSSSEDEDSFIAESSLSKLSSERGFSPDNPASPDLND